MTVLRTGALFQHRLTLNMIKFQLSNERCCLHSEHVCAKSVTGDKKRLPVFDMARTVDRFLPPIIKSKGI